MATVVLPDPIAEEAIIALKKRYNVAALYEKDFTGYDANDVVAIICRYNPPISREWMEEHPNLKIIVSHGTGYSNLADFDAAKERGICIANTPGKNALSVAEHTIALMLALAKGLLPVTRQYPKEGSEARFKMQYTEISQKTLGLIGVGNIGRIVAEIAGKGFGMKVLAYDPYVKTPMENVEMTDDRMRVFRESDYVSLHLPLLESTYQSVGCDEFSAMKNTAYLINCARGALVDQSALIRALESGVIAGAGLDVTDPDECPADSPLFQMDNVVLTPHIAASTKESLYRVGMECVRTINDYLDGKGNISRII